MRIPLVDLLAQYQTIKKEIDSAIQSVIYSSSFILGPNVNELEREIAEYTNCQYAIGVASGTDALVLALKAYDIGHGDEVITSPFTFFASAESIYQVGASPVFVDIDARTFNMDVNLIENKITERTKAIIPVHIFGQPVDMDKVSEVATRHQLIVIEDACQAIGAQYKNKTVGSIGHAACFSFYPTKNLGAYGDGGMIVTSDKQVAEKITILRSHGQRRKYYNDMLGYNSRLDELQAAILRVKLKHLDSWNRARRQRAHYYNKKLAETAVVSPFESEDSKHVYHLYVLLSDKRNDLFAYLKTVGVGAGIYYPKPLHLQKACESLGYKVGDFPVAEDLSSRAIAIPLYPELTKEQQDYVVERVIAFG